MDNVEYERIRQERKRGEEDEMRESGVLEGPFSHAQLAKRAEIMRKWDDWESARVGELMAAKEV